MLSDDTRSASRADAALAGTVASLTRRSVWQLIGELPLRFDAYHPQGMVRIGDIWWISTVDIDGCRGLVLAVDRDGELVDSVPVGDDVRYHPGGMDFDGTSLWIPCAEYRPASSTAVHRLEPGGVSERAFDVDDHVGAIARAGHDGDLIGWNWGSRRFFRWTVGGRLLDQRINPGFFVDHQDAQWLGTGHLLCGGVAEVRMASGPAWLGGLGLLRVDDLVMEREVPFPIYPSASGRVATHNPIWSEVDGDRLIVHLLPDDGHGAILSYSTPLTVDVTTGAAIEATAG